MLPSPIPTQLSIIIPPLPLPTIGSKLQSIGENMFQAALNSGGVSVVP